MTDTTRAEGEEKIGRWAAYCAALLAEDPANYARLDRGLANLADAVHDTYPDFMEGERVTIPVEPLADLMEPLSEQTQQQYLELTVDVLLTGSDGPHPTAEVLAAALRTMVTEIARAAHIDNTFQMARDN